MATPKVRAATAATPTVLAPWLPKLVPTSNGSAILSLYTSSSLSRETQDALYMLFDANMHSLADGTSMVNSEQAKREEMFNSEARFLLLYRELPMPGALPRFQRGQEEKDVINLTSEDLLGFSSFRFDTEETRGSWDAEVIYCYEIHLVPGARGHGLGNILITELEAIGRAWRMEKAMLTCLANNSAALRFYAKAGYVPDEIDPVRMSEEDGNDSDLEDVTAADYRILSKSFK